MITVVDAGGSLYYNDSVNDIDVYFNKDSFQSRRKGDEIWLNDETYKENFNFSEVSTAEPTAEAWLVSLNSFLPTGGGGGGDASAANQTAQIAIETGIEANTASINTKQSTIIASNAEIEISAKNIDENTKKSGAGELFSRANQTFVNANSTGTEYMIVGARQVSAGAAEINTCSVYGFTNDSYIFRVRLNPTIDGLAPIWTSLGPYMESAVARAGNPTQNTVSGGTVLHTRYGTIQSREVVALLGATILNGDVVVVTAEPLSTNLDIFGSINTRQV